MILWISFLFFGIQIYHHTNHNDCKRASACKETKKSKKEVNNNKNCHSEM